MKILRTLQICFVVALLCAALSPRASADEWNKETLLTTNNSLEVPGYILDPGTYVFKLADNPAYRHIVQIWTGDKSQLIATIIAIPAYRDEVTDEPVFRLDERPGDSPMAIRSWFYPGEHYGNEFTYPRSKYYSNANYNNTDNGCNNDNSTYNNDDNTNSTNPDSNSTYNNDNITDNGSSNNTDNNNTNPDNNSNPDSESSPR
jgi:hypothetical protein